jgi:hypothetical protein
MFETYRVLGRHHEAELLREAEKVARAAAAGASTSRGHRNALYALASVLTRLGSRRSVERASRDLRHSR